MHHLYRFAGACLCAALLTACGGNSGHSSLPALNPSQNSKPALARHPEATVATLYSFAGSPDGAHPAARLVAGAALLYGTTEVGGTNGTVFQMTPTGSESVDYRFAGSPDGAYPQGGLLIAGNTGAFYGTTPSGGTGNGTVFQLNSSGESVLYTFTGAPDGATPLAGLIADSAGNLYGTTESGGTSNMGTVFRVTPAGVETILYSFTGIPDGAYPEGDLIAIAGKFYGTTASGGTGYSGTVFKLTPTGSGYVESILHNFSDHPNGAYPQGGVVAVGTPSRLYGTTANGGANNNGTVFKMNLSGSGYSVLYSFTANPDGAHPSAGLTWDNVAPYKGFYGTTLLGGTSNKGTIFKIKMNGVESVLYSFTGSSPDGAYPEGGLLVFPFTGVPFGGSIAGTTFSGGASGNGTVYEVLL